MVPGRQFQSDRDRRYETLLQMTDLMVQHRTLPELFRALAELLRTIANFDFTGFSLYDPSSNTTRLYSSHASDEAEPLEFPIEGSASGWVWQYQQPVVVPHTKDDTCFPRTASFLREKGINSYCTLPLTTAQRRLGALNLGSSRPNAYAEAEVELLRRVAGLVALAIESALTRVALKQEKQRLQLLLELNRTLVSGQDTRQLFPVIAGILRNAVKQDYASLALADESAQNLRLYALDSSLAASMIGENTVISVRESLAGQAFLRKETRVFTREDMAALHSDFLDGMLEAGICSFCSVPLVTRNGVLGTLNLASREQGAFLSQDIDFLQQAAAQMAVALDNVHAYYKIGQLQDKLAKEKLYLESEIRSALNFEEIVGDSPVLQRLLAQVQIVAPSDATVLIQGETGTGKELIARAIHRLSTRREASFIKLNCAAIPTGLLESELFGHEKGAFTGAISQKVGRLELADKGTLFLDEVGDIPLELQPKLLRVLQDQEFERLGSTRTIRVNIRLIAATNRDLTKGVADREFRSDLYYRLNVFPLRTPALRERREDIALLVGHFVRLFARRMNKPIETIPTETMNALTSWEWPGNVRELENFIERSVILTNGSALNVPLAELQPSRDLLPGESGSTLESMEREHIVRTLRETGGVIAGLNGAAARLGLKRTTLQSRMQRMGISRREYEN